MVETKITKKTNSSIFSPFFSVPSQTKPIDNRKIIPSDFTCVQQQNARTSARHQPTKRGAGNGSTHSCGGQARGRRHRSHARWNREQRSSLCAGGRGSSHPGPEAL